MECFLLLDSRASASVRRVLQARSHGLPSGNDGTEPSRADTLTLINQLEIFFVNESKIAVPQPGKNEKAIMSFGFQRGTVQTNRIERKKHVLNQKEDQNASGRLGPC